MTRETEDRIIAQLNAYADNVLGDIDPQKVKIVQQLAAVSELYAPVAAQQDLLFQFLFQAIDISGDCRLGKIKPLACPGKTACFHNSHQYFQLPKFHYVPSLFLSSFHF